MLASLRTVSDRQILTDTDNLVAQDRKLTLRLLAYLHEVDRRKLYLGQGYSSMFDYCRTHLRLSEGSAMRRIRTARCLARFPELHPLLESGEVNLTSVALMSRLLTPANAATLIERVCGKSKREVEAIIAELEPQTMVPRDCTRVIVVPVAAVGMGASNDILVPAADAPVANSTATGGGKNAGGGFNERRTVVQFAARDEFMSKVERARMLIWHRHPSATFEQIFEMALDELIARRDPVERTKRREQRASVSRKQSAIPGRRFVSAAVRDNVFVRDGFRCAFVGADGRRCTETVALQVDHVRPVARGGASTANNLRILCVQHNRLEADRIMGCGRPPERMSQ